MDSASSLEAPTPDPDRTIQSLDGHAFGASLFVRTLADKRSTGIVPRWRARPAAA